MKLCLTTEGFIFRSKMEGMGAKGTGFGAGVWSQAH
jgi:hypothetical protein